jgi:hypothetical protein
MMSFFSILGHIGKAISAIKDLSNRIAAFHSDPIIQAAIAASPALKAQSDAISADVRTLQDALK